MAYTTGHPHQTGRLSLDKARPTIGWWRTWTTTHPALTGLSWARFRSELANGDAARKDELLTALACIGRHDPAAVGVIVAALAPGIARRVTRHAPGLAVEDAWSVATEGVCAALARGGLPSTNVASALLDSAKRHLRRAVERQAAWQRLVCLTGERPELAAAGAGEESGRLLLTTAQAAGVLTRTEVWLLAFTVLEGRRIGDAARHLGLGYEATKKRRLRALARWQSWWDALPAGGGRGGEP